MVVLIRINQAGYGFSGYDEQMDRRLRMDILNNNAKFIFMQELRW
jgi:hypothetical protein